MEVGTPNINGSLSGAQDVRGDREEPVSGVVTTTRVSVDAVLGEIMSPNPILDWWLSQEMRNRTHSRFTPLRA